MKIKIILALLISTLCNAQITLNDMKTILNNDIDYIETFALSKGYSFNKIIDYDEMEGIQYSKGVGKDSKHLTFYSSFYKIGKKTFHYQTSRQNEYLLIKKQLIEQGFKLIKTYDNEGVLYKEYKNKRYYILLRTGISQYPTLTEFYCADIEFIE